MAPFALFPIALVDLASSSGLEQPMPPQLQGLPEEISGSGGGTFFYFLKKQNTPPIQVFWYSDPNEGGNVQINGKYHQLKFDFEKIVKKGQGRKGLGQRSIQRWSDETVILILDSTINSLQEEGVGLNGTIKITVKGHSNSYKVTGYNGS